MRVAGAIFLCFRVLLLLLWATGARAECPFGWLEAPDASLKFCYQFNRESVVFDEAHRLCKAAGADLASFSTQSEADFIYNKTQKLGAGVVWWTGLTSNGDYEFYWTDGTTTMDFVKWAFPNPIHLPPLFCAELEKGYFNSAPCIENYAFVCKMRNDKVPKCDTQSGGVWHSGPDGRCYRFYNTTDDQRVWQSAHDECARQGATLPIIRDADMQTWIDYRFKVGTRYWLGMLPDPENSPEPKSRRWKWQSGDPMNYRRWHDASDWGYEPEDIYPKNESATWRAYSKDSEWYSKPGLRPNFACVREQKTSCAVGWTLEGSRCFLPVVTERVAWSTADERCKRRGAQLVVIKNASHQVEVKGLLAGITGLNFMWIGANQKDRDYFWVDGTRITNNPNAAADGVYVAWLRQPDFVNAGCVKIATDPAAESKWETASCSDVGGYICELPFDTPERPPSTLPTSPSSTVGKGGCDPGWTLFEDQQQCYLESTRFATQDEALKYCSTFTAKVPQIETVEQQEAIVTRLRLRQFNWLRMTRENHTSQWTDYFSPVTYFNWADGEPRAAEGLNCAVLFFDPTSTAHGRWYARNCSEANHVFCQDRAWQQKPTPTQSTPPPTSAQCEWPWEDDHHSEWCYQFHFDWRVTFAGGVTSCQALGGELASISSPADRNYIAGRLRSHPGTTDAWLGLRAAPDSWTWAWQDGRTPVSYLYWERGFPDWDDTNRCVGLSAASGRMINLWCNKLTNYICKRKGKPLTGATTLPTTAAPTTMPLGMRPGCDTSRLGYEYNPATGQCYAYTNRRINWEEARAACAESGGALASIHSEEENRFVSALITRINPLDRLRAWLGLRDVAQNLDQMYFEWLSGERVVYTRWAEKEPTNAATGGISKDCVSMRQRQGETSFGWGDEFCSQATQLDGFVCKAPAKPVLEGLTTLDGCPKPSGGSMLQTVWDGYKCVYLDLLSAATFDEAKAACGQRIPGANLLVITYRSQQAALTTTLIENSITAHMWIGLEAERQGNTSRVNLKWVTGADVSIQNFDSSLNRLNDKGGAAVGESSAPGLWNLRFGTDRIGYICERVRDGRTTPLITTTTQDPSTCHWGLVDYRNWCFGLYGTNDPSDTAHRKNFAEAAKSCLSLNGVLASIESDSFNSLIRRKYQSVQYGIWLGVRGSDHGFEWMDGEPFLYANWGASGPPVLNDQRGCVEMQAGSPFWAAQSCSERKFYLCKFPKGILSMTTPPAQPPTTPAPETTRPCWESVGNRTYDPAWQLWAGNCYYFSGKATDWFRARAMCRGLSGELVSLLSEAENNFTRDMFPAYTSHNRLWTGLNEIEGLNFRWSDQAPVSYINWDDGQPDDAGGAELCVLMSSSGRWQDAMCTRSLPYVCKRWLQNRPTPPPPPRPVGNCPPSWAAFRNKCYRVLNASANFAEAIGLCRSLLPVPKKAFLTSVIDKYENAFIMSQLRLIGLRSGYVWTGLWNRKEHAKCDIQWQSNEPLFYTNWAPGQPAQCYEDMVAAMLVADGKWETVSASSRLPPVCMSYKDTDVEPPPPTRCKKDWTLYGDRCYRSFGSEFVSWPEALQACEATNDNLVSVHSVFGQSYLQASLFDQPTNALDSGFWIGLNSRSTGQVLEWSNKWQFSYAYWGPREPQMDDQKRCVLMDGNTGSWSMRDCNEKHAYICMDTRAYNAQPPPTAAPDIGGSCPEGWDTQLGGFCYSINITRGILFTDAFAQCRALGAGSELAAIGSEPEQEFVLAVVKRQYDLLSTIAGRPHDPNQVWLGFVYRDGRLTALDNSPITFTNWLPNQPNPNAAPSRMYCVSMEAVSGRWSSVPCSDDLLYGLVCRRPKLLTTTSTTSSVGLETSSSRRTTTTSTWRYSTSVAPTQQGFPMAVTIVLSVLAAVVLLVVAAFIALLVVRRMRPQLLEALPEPVRRVATANSFSDLRGQQPASTFATAEGNEKGAQAAAATAGAGNSTIENPIYAANSAN